jgi:CTP synthase
MCGPSRLEGMRARTKRITPALFFFFFFFFFFAQSVREKLSMFCQVKPSHVLCIHDLKSIYHVPLLLEQQDLVSALSEGLALGIAPTKDANGETVELKNWRSLTERFDSLTREVPICLVGK